MSKIIMIFYVFISISETFCFTYINGPHRTKSMRTLPSYSPHHSSRYSSSETEMSDDILKTPPTRYSNNDTEQLQRRVLLLETLIKEICGAIMYSDDIAMSERQVSECGKIYRDSMFKEIRKPVLVRSSIKKILESRGMDPIPMPHCWYLDVDEKEKK